MVTMSILGGINMYGDGLNSEGDNPAADKKHSYRRNGILIEFHDDNNLYGIYL